MSAEPILKFRCDECGATHDREADAEDRWYGHQIPQIADVYACPFCAEEHETEDLCLECIAGHAADGLLPHPTAAELEAAGQMRLLP